MKQTAAYLFLLAVVCCSKISAQQDPMYSMYMFDRALINPAFAGSSDWVVGTVKYRDQNNAMTGHPSTQTFNFHAPLQKQHLGLGLKVVQDRVAVMSSLNAAVQISYHLQMGGGKLSLGLEGGIFNRRMDYQKLILSSRGDNVIPSSATTVMVPDAAVGIYYQKKQFYLGLADYHLVNKGFQADPAALLRQRAQLYLIAGNVFEFNRRWSLEPSVLLKYRDASAMQADVNMMLYYDEIVGAGIQYRSGDALVGVLRVFVTEKLRIAYAYDKTISKMSPYAGATHEIILSYGIRLLPPARQKEIHPRYYF